MKRMEFCQELPIPELRTIQDILKFPKNNCFFSAIVVVGPGFLVRVVHENFQINSRFFDDSIKQESKKSYINFDPHG